MTQVSINQHIAGYLPFCVWLSCERCSCVLGCFAIYRSSKSLQKSDEFRKPKSIFGTQYSHSDRMRRQFMPAKHFSHSLSSLFVLISLNIQSLARRYHNNAQLINWWQLPFETYNYTNVLSVTIFSTLLPMAIIVFVAHSCSTTTTPMSRLISRSQVNHLHETSVFIWMRVSLILIDDFSIISSSLNIDKWKQLVQPFRFSSPKIPTIKHAICFQDTWEKEVITFRLLHSIVSVDIVSFAMRHHRIECKKSFNLRFHFVECCLPLRFCLLSHFINSGIQVEYGAHIGVIAFGSSIYFPNVRVCDSTLDGLDLVYNY